MDVIYFLLVGLVAGWLAGLYMNVRGMSWVQNLIVGVIGAVIGGFLFDCIGFGRNGLLAKLITATIGAVILLAIVGKVTKPKRRRR